MNTSCSVIKMVEISREQIREQCRKLRLDGGHCGTRVHIWDGLHLCIDLIYHRLGHCVAYIATHGLGIEVQVLPPLHVIEIASLSPFYYKCPA